VEVVGHVHDEHEEEGAPPLSGWTERHGLVAALDHVRSPHAVLIEKHHGALVDYRARSMHGDQSSDSATETLLTRRSGEVLILFGLLLVGLACLFADEATVAPIFAFGAVASVVLGIVLSRVEGDFELSPTGLKTRLLAVQQIAVREDLTLEEKADNMIDVVERGETLHGSWRAVLAATSAANRAESFLAAVRDDLEANGWEVDEPGVRDPFMDLVARRDGQRVGIIAKAVRPLSKADVEKALAPLSLWDGSLRHGLAVYAGALSAEARRWLTDQHPRVTVFEVTTPGMR
jgi:hypothetical protein